MIEENEKYEEGVPMQKFKINWSLWLEVLLLVIAIKLIFHIFSNIEAISSSIQGFLGVISPYIIGFIIAYFLNVPCDFLEKQFSKIKKFPFIAKRARGFSILALYLFVISIVALIISYVFPIIIQNIFEFVSSIPMIYDEALIWLNNLDLSNLYGMEEDMRSFFDTFELQNIFSHITTGLNSIGSFAMSMGMGMGMGVLDMFLSLVTSIYVLLYKKDIFALMNRIAKLFMKESQLKILKSYVVRANNIFYKFISTQFLDACILGILATILLMVLNVSFAVTLGIFLGICNMIPKFGSIFGSIVVMIIAFFTGGLTHGIIVIVSLTVLQQIDGNIIGPKLMGDALDINPIVVFIALTVGGAYFGVIGMFLAIPVAVMMKIILIELMEERERRLQA